MGFPSIPFWHDDGLPVSAGPFDQVSYLDQEANPSTCHSPFGEDFSGRPVRFNRCPPNLPQRALLFKGLDLTVEIIASHLEPV